MSDWFTALLTTFIPLFIATDVFGNLFYVISATEGLPPQQQRRTVHIAVLTSALIGMVFLFFGQLILRTLAVTVGSFTIAAGAILLVLSVNFILTGQPVQLTHDKYIAISPIGTPLLAGPAQITTLLLLSTQYSLYIVLISFAINLLLAWLILLGKTRILGALGQGGLRAVGNVFNLLLAAIGVSMMLRGLTLLDIITPV